MNTLTRIIGAAALIALAFWSGLQSNAATLQGNGGGEWAFGLICLALFAVGGTLLATIKPAGAPHLLQLQ